MFYTDIEILEQKIKDQEQVFKAADDLISLGMKEKEEATDKILTLKHKLNQLKKAASEEAA